MDADRLIEWVEFYGNASAFAAISLCAKDGRSAARFFASNADMALAKVREGIAELADERRGAVTG